MSRSPPSGSPTLTTESHFFSSLSDHSSVLRGVPGFSSSPSSQASSAPTSNARDSTDLQRQISDDRDNVGSTLLRKSGSQQYHLLSARGEQLKSRRGWETQIQSAPFLDEQDLTAKDRVNPFDHASFQHNGFPWATISPQASTGLRADREDSKEHWLANRSIVGSRSDSSGAAQLTYANRFAVMPPSPAPSSARQPSTSPKLGLGRLPEDEIAPESRHSTSSARESPFTAGPRSRSTSSAAALQSFTSSSSLENPALDSFGSSSSIWAPGASQRRHAPLRAQTSFSDMGTSPFDPMEAARSMPFGRPFVPRAELLHGERGRPIDSYATHQRQDSRPETIQSNAAATNESGADKSGSESRRHSVTGSAPVTGQRRAVGFEMNRPGVGSRTASVGRPLPPPHSQSTMGLFGNGDSAIADDDLASEFDALSINLSELAQQQQSGHTIRTGMQRAASLSTNLVGGHAASLPPVYSTVGTSSASRSVFQEWPLSARLPEEEAADAWGKGSITPQRRATESGDSHRPWEHVAAAQYDPAAAYGTSVSQSSSRGPLALSGAQFASSSSLGGAFEPFRAFAEPPAPPLHSSASLSNLSDFAIASLSTLGPLAPAGGPGGPDPFGGLPGSSSSLASGLSDLGKGVPLQMLSRDTSLYIVEFKQGRTDLYFCQTQPGMPSTATENIRKGDLVIVEADRGKDLGTVINDSISVEQVQTFLAHQADLTLRAAGDAGLVGSTPVARLTRSINPKRLFAKAGPSETSLLHAKAQDEERALTLCTTKVNQRGLPMSVVAAELQWDRRKLTFYYTATQRVDFRDLVKELFRLYKTRIWMCHLSHPSGGTG